jgi:hypothetical protein
MNWCVDLVCEGYMCRLHVTIKLTFAEIWTSKAMEVKNKRPNLKKTMSKPFAHNPKLDNTNHLWNIALDNYELDG